MEIVRALWYALLGLADAILPATTVEVMTYVAVSIRSTPSLIQPVATAAGITLAVGTVVGFVVAAQRERPLTMTRFALRAWWTHLFRRW